MASELVMSFKGNPELKYFLF